jgi:hypothetical protein
MNLFDQRRIVFLNKFQEKTKGIGRHRIFFQLQGMNKGVVIGDLIKVLE